MCKKRDGSTSLARLNCYGIIIISACRFGDVQSVGLQINRWKGTDVGTVARLLNTLAL